jgi:cell division protein FtsB
MQEFRKKRVLRRRLYSLPVLIILAIILVFLIRGVWGMYQKASFSEEKRTLAEAEHAALEEKRASIEAEIASFNTETGIEREVRSKFDVAREGEQVIVLVDPAEPVEAPAAKPTGIKGFFTTVFSWFQ